LLASAIAMAAAFTAPVPAKAEEQGLTAYDVGVAMDPAGFTGWAFGAGDMAAQLFRRMGDGVRADCILKWTGSKESVREISDAMIANPKLQAAAVMEVLMKRHCGDY
jgi:hypothetical protein